MSIVPTEATRAIARAIIRDTRDDGADATLRHLQHVHPDQLAALVALLAREAAARRLPPGPIGARVRLTLPAVLTPEERRQAHAAWTRGQRDPWVIAGEREYQRMRTRVRRRPRRLQKAG